MTLREWTGSFAGGTLAKAMSNLNARHPWSHNDHFHRWILANLPERRGKALDVGCGRGDLLGALSPYFLEVLGTDVDEAMRQAAALRCASMPNASVTGDALIDIPGEYDLITMISVLHHFEDMAAALHEVRRLLAPGGRFLVVGHSVPRSRRDYVWDGVCIVTNPIIGFAKHPKVNRLGVQPPAFPVLEPKMSFEEIREAVDSAMPGATMQRRLGFRHTISWTRPLP